MQNLVAPRHFCEWTSENHKKMDIALLYINRGDIGVKNLTPF